MLLSEFTTSGQLDLLQLLDEIRTVQQHTRKCMPILVDMNIHYRILKFMHGESAAQYDVRQWLGSLPLVYGVWHPYKYCVLQVYRQFFPIFAQLEASGGLAEGVHLHCLRKVLHVEKLVCCLLLVRNSVVRAVERELKKLREGAMSSAALATGVQAQREATARATWLQGFQDLLNIYCPALLNLGVAVRSCTWEGRSERRGDHARGVLQDCTVLLAMLLGDKAAKKEYVRTLGVALLAWDDWMDSIPACCYQEENCEALLSRMAGRCRANKTITSLEGVTDLFLTLPPPSRKPKATRGLRSL